MIISPKRTKRFSPTVNALCAGEYSKGSSKEALNKRAEGRVAFAILPVVFRIPESDTGGALPKSYVAPRHRLSSRSLALVATTGDRRYDKHLT